MLESVTAPDVLARRLTVTVDTPVGKEADFSSWRFLPHHFSFPQAVPSIGGPFLVLHNCGESSTKCTLLPTFCIYFFLPYEHTRGARRGRGVGSFDRKKSLGRTPSRTARQASGRPGSWWMMTWSSRLYSYSIFSVIRV